MNLTLFQWHRFCELVQVGKPKHNSPRLRLELPRVHPARIAYTAGPRLESDSIFLAYLAAERPDFARALAEANFPATHLRFPFNTELSGRNNVTSARSSGVRRGR